jgi:hypothetical protein
VGFLHRLFSSDYRRALAAEAASDYSLAARLYAVCGESLKVAEMHLFQLREGAPREEVVGRLREAARWAREGAARDPIAAQPTVRRIARGLAAQGERDAPTLPVDADLMREAAGLAELASAWREGAEYLERAGEPGRAAELWGRAGDLVRMETLLDRERELGRESYVLRESWEQYRLETAAGNPEAARAALSRCIESPLAGPERTEYLRLRDELDARRLEGGFVALRPPGGYPVVYASGFPVWLGRDGASGLALGDSSVSRQHARIDLTEGRLVLSDCASRNGTFLAGVPLGDAVALGPRGEIALGDGCQLEFETSADRAPPRLELKVLRGRERGWRLCAQLAPFALAAGLELRFERRRPILRSLAGPLVLNGTQAAAEIELLRRDRVLCRGEPWEVL